MSSPSKHVMISYQWDHQNFAKKLYEALKSRGSNVWMDIQGGILAGDINDAMAIGVQNAYAIVPIISEKYQRSKNCKKELSYADVLDVDFFPVRIEADFKESDWLGVLIGAKLWYDFRDTSQFSKQIDHLASAIKSKVPRNEQEDLFNKYWKGKVYWQNGLPAVAAYHFESFDNVYINWSLGPDIDERYWRDADGKPVREYNGNGFKKFVNMKFGELTFTGDIDFIDGPQFKYEGDDRDDSAVDYVKIWHYSFKVSDDRKIIESGKVMTESYEGNSFVQRFGKELHYAISHIDESPRAKERNENYYRRLYQNEKVLHEETKMKLLSSEARVHELKQENTEFRTNSQFSQLFV